MSRSMGSISGRRARSWRCCASRPPTAAPWCLPFISWRMPNASPIACCCSQMESHAVRDRWRSCGPVPEIRQRAWRRSSLRSPEVKSAPILPLIRKELSEVLGGRALWTMLLLMCPLVGYSYFQALSLYADASIAGEQSPVLATSLSPLDGVLVPTFGAFYVAVTLLFPFVAIRVLGREKETGALRMLVQLPYRPFTLAAAKIVAILVAWWAASIPVLCTLVIWKLSGG